MAEAQELGISIVMFAGGEPLTRPEILDITADFPGIIFPLFTNGMLLDEKLIARLQPAEERGAGAQPGRASGRDRRAPRPGSLRPPIEHDAGAEGAQRLLRASLTVTRQNFETITDKAFIGELIGAGCKLFFFVDYVPVQEGTEELS